MTRYGTIAAFIAIAFLINVFLSIIFYSYTKGKAKIYLDKVTNNGKNMVWFGIAGLFGVAIGNGLGGASRYVIMIIMGAVVLIGLVQFIFILVTTIALDIGDKSHNGIENTGKWSDWIFLASGLLDNALMCYIAFFMFTEFF